MNKEMLSYRDVGKMTGKSRSTISRWSNKGYFPKPKEIGPGIILWLKDDVDRWLENLAEKGAKTNALSLEHPLQDVKAPVKVA